MSTLICFDSNEDIVLLYNISENKYIYLADEIRSYSNDKDKPLDIAAFKQKARTYDFYVSNSDEDEPRPIDRRLVYSHLGLRSF